MAISAYPCSDLQPRCQGVAREHSMRTVGPFGLGIRVASAGCVQKLFEERAPDQGDANSIEQDLT